MTDLLKLISRLKELVPRENRGNDYVMEYIDMGHGGIINDEYVTAPKKMYSHGEFTFYEGLWTRAIGWMYAMELYIQGLSYLIITPGHKDYSLGYRTGTANTHAENMAYNWKQYYHAIHGNAHGVQAANGIEVYTSPGQTPADPIATVMFNNLKAALRWRMRPDAVGDGDPDKEARFTVLMDTDMASVLSETGFYSNLAECKRMLDYGNMQKIVRAFRTTHETVVYKNMLR